jgi:hypothetical protein
MAFVLNFRIQIKPVRVKVYCQREKNLLLLIKLNDFFHYKKHSQYCCQLHISGRYR